MSYRIDLSALTTAELDDVAGRLAAGVPHEQVAAFVHERTAAHLQATCARLLLTGDDDQPQGHVGSRGDDYGHLLARR